MGLDPNHQMTEREIHDYYIPEGVGVHWRDLARALKFLEQVIKTIKEENGNNPKECCTDLMVRWLGREGRDATAGVLADSLRRIGLKNVSDRLICPSRDSVQINGFEEFREMKVQLSSLEAKVTKMSAKIKKLEEENQELRGRLGLEAAGNYEQDVVYVEEPDQAARERSVSDQLKDVNDQLKTYVISPLEVSEVKQDQLNTPVKIDLLTNISRRLQELYSKMQALVGEACQCSEDLKRDYYDLANNGLRAAHNDVIHRVVDLKSLQEKMTEEEKGNFQKLQTYQGNRQRQVEMLDNLWKNLFKFPEPLPKAPVSQPLAASEKPRDNKKKLSRHSDPGARPKQLKSGKDVASAERPQPGKDERVDGVCLNFTQQKSAIGSMKSFFKKKDNDEKQCSVVSYTPRRDS